MAFDWKTSLARAIATPTPDADALQRAEVTSRAALGLHNWSERVIVRVEHSIDYLRAVRNIAMEAKLQFADVADGVAEKIAGRDS